MFRIVAFLAFAICQVFGGAVEVLPAEPVAPIAAGIITARSTQYFAQNHNALAAPLIAPVEPVAPVLPAARIEAIAPVAPVAPVAQYIAPSASSVSQVTRYAQYVAPAVTQYVSAPYVAPAPIVQGPLVTPVARTAPLIASAPLALGPVARAAPFITGAPLAVAPVARATPFVASAPLAVAPIARTAPLVAGPLLSRAPVAVASAQPVAPVQPLAPVQPGVPQLPSANPAFQAPNPDSESVEIESARLRSLPQARSQPAEQQGAPGPVPETRFQNYPNFPPQDQQNLDRYQEQLRAQNQPLPSGPVPQNVAQARNQAAQLPSGPPAARNQGQEQQQQSAAPGLLSAQQYIQGPYLG